MGNNTMLIADESALSREELRQIFGDQYDYIEVRSGREVLDIAESSQVQVVLLDHVLPDMDGMEVLRLRQGMDRFREVPVVLVTDSTNIEDQVLALKLGASDFINKPFVPELVSQRVNNVVTNRAKFAQVMAESEKLRYQTEIDRMTGLLNKVTAEEVASSILRNAPDQDHALMVIDIDDFKKINDSEGHQAGDAAIAAISKLLLQCFRQSDVVGRVGGDEFVALMVNVPAESAARHKVKRLTEAVRECTAGDVPGGVSISIGYALTGGESITYEALFRRADEALYEAKRSGKSRACRFGSRDTQRAPANDDMKTILVVDDHAVNRMVLVKILSAEYSVIEAENGRDALQKLESSQSPIDGIVLDLVMPVMDGFEFLSVIQGREAYHNIPIIVATGNESTEHETKALMLGAWDFVTKPYNAEVLKFRLRNAIIRSQLTAFNQLKYLAEFDPLTGIYNKRKFFDTTRDVLLANMDRQFVFVRCDIANFKLVNSYFGMREGDRVLRRLSAELRTFAAASPLVTYGHIQADVFCVCAPFGTESEICETLQTVTSKVSEMLDGFKLVPYFGVYIVRDHTMSVDMMYDNAIVASGRCKGSYVNNYVFYEDSMRATMERETELAGQMPEALRTGQFLVYYQPKYDVRTGSPQGAEALVRWAHPKLGMIPPGEFIPVFEKNGLVSRLDRYVWEEVCRMLSDWKKRGEQVMPISVNVSRINFYNPRLVEQLKELTDKYDIPTSLLNLEITETAYSENPRLMQKTVAELQKLGFIIMMDDFGSGYSSLNVLKDLPVDVLKVDMKFLPEHANGRAERILASVVRMAKWLDMQVIVEGVETEEQVKFLQSVGCDFIQGYYYAKPMPEMNFKSLLAEHRMGEKEPERSEEARRELNEMWSASEQAVSVFDRLACPVSIYGYRHGEEPRILKTNKEFSARFGYDADTADDVRKYVADDQQRRILDAFGEASDGQGTAQCEYMRMGLDNMPMWVLAKLRYEGMLEGQSIILAVFIDITAVKQTEFELAQFQSIATLLEQDTSPAPVSDDR